MGATHSTTYHRPDGTVVEQLLDESNPEHARIIAGLTQDRDPTLRRLDARAQGEVAREQYQQNVREQVERLPFAQRVLAQAGSAAVGFADAATVGLTQVAARQLLGERGSANAEAFREATPEGNTAGYLAGIVGPAIATGGSTLVGQGAERGAATLAASGFTNQLGNTIARRIAGNLAPRMGEPAARALGTAIGLGADGAVSGALDAIAEANIEDTPYSGERILSNMLFGAALGVGMGIPAGALESRLVSLGGRAEREAAEQLQEAGLAQVFDQEVVPRLGEFRSLEPAARRDLANTILRNSTVMQNDAHRAQFDIFYQNIDRALDGTGWRQSVANQVRSQMDEVIDSVETAGAESLDAGRRQARFARMAEAASPEAIAAGNNHLRNAIRLVDEVPGTALSPQALQTLRRMAGEVSETAHISPAWRAEALGRLDRVLDELPRNVPGDRTASRLLEGAEDGADEVSRAGLRATLESAGDSWAPSFAASRRARDSYETVRQDLRRLGQPNAAGRWRFDTNRLVNELGSSEVATRGAARETLQGWLRASDDVLAASGDTAVRARLMDTHRLLEDTVQWGQAVGAYEFLLNLERGTSGFAAGVGNKGMWLGAGLAGLASGNPLVAAGGIALAGFGHPVSLVARLHSLTRMLGKSGERAARATGALRSAMERPRLVSGRAARAAGLGARQVPRVVLALRKPEKRQEEYDRVVETVRQYAANPQMMLSRVEAITEGVGSTHPGIASGIASTMVAGILHLAENLPPPTPPTPFPSRPRRPSTAEMEDLVRRLEAIEDPLSILERAADGSLTAAHVDAVRAVYPRLYQEMAAEVVGIMGSLQSPPPYQLRVRTGLLLGMPCDPTQEAPFTWACQQTFAQSAEQNAAQLGRGPSATMSTRVATDTMSRAASVTHNL